MHVIAGMMSPVKTAPVTMSLDTRLLHRLRSRAKTEGISLSALVNRELMRREAAEYFAVSERIHSRENFDLDALTDELASDTDERAAR